MLAFFLLVSMFSARFLGPQKKALEVTRVQHRHTCCQTKTHIAHFFSAKPSFFGPKSPVMAKTTCCCSDCYAKCMTAPAYPANLRWTQRCVKVCKTFTSTGVCINHMNMHRGFKHACMHAKAPFLSSLRLAMLQNLAVSNGHTHTCIDTDKNSQASNGSG